MKIYRIYIICFVDERVTNNSSSNYNLMDIASYVVDNEACISDTLIFHYSRPNRPPSRSFISRVSRCNYI